MSAIPLRTLIVPAVEHLAAAYRAPGGPAPMAMMAAIGLQESKFEARDQLEVQNGRLVPGAIGPATGFWQFERAGGVRGVMTHPASRDIAREMALAAGVPFDADAIWRHFATIEGDELAAVFARLLLLTDPQPLPEPVPENEQIAWAYYLRNWRPGKPHPEYWPDNWAAAIAAVRELSPGPTAPRSVSVPQSVESVELERRVAELERKLALAADALG